MTIRLLPHSRDATFVVVHVPNPEDLIELEEMLGPQRWIERSRSLKTISAPPRSPSAPPRLRCGRCPKRKAEFTVRGLAIHNARMHRDQPDLPKLRVGDPELAPEEFRCVLCGGPETMSAQALADHLKSRHQEGANGRRRH